MKLTKIKIENFRNLKDVEIPIENTTILLGQNNSGKSSLIDALKILLDKKNNKDVFNETDFYTNQSLEEMEDKPPILIRGWFEEREKNEWPNEIFQELKNAVILDPISGLRSIILQVRTGNSSDNENSKEGIWEFLSEDFIAKKDANYMDVQNLDTYIKYYYLDALRDAASYFSQRSKFWGGMLKELDIDESIIEDVQISVREQNTKLLESDERINKLIEKIKELQKITGDKKGQNTEIQPISILPWELMSKSELYIKENSNSARFPLSSQGQGTQSLSVLYLFQAYVYIFLKPKFNEETEAIIAIEEPETHLHPHAVRGLADTLIPQRYQKIISTHSPYFVQNASIGDIRLLRRQGAYSDILYLKSKFTTEIPKIDDIIKMCENVDGYHYDEFSNRLTIEREMTQREKETILEKLGSDKLNKQNIEKLYNQSKLIIEKSDLYKLEIFIQRLRGDILFARTWLLCEGQSEYEFFSYLSKKYDLNFDTVGISIIDFQNNGNPKIFIKLAEHFEIPWILTVDNDQAGKNYIKKIGEKFDFLNELPNRIVKLPADCTDFEDFLMKKGFSEYFLKVLHNEYYPDNDGVTTLVDIKETKENKEDDLRVKLMSQKQDDDSVYKYSIEFSYKQETITEKDDSFNDKFLNLLRRKFQTDKVRYIRALIYELEKSKWNGLSEMDYLERLFSRIKEVM